MLSLRTLIKKRERMLRMRRLGIAGRIRNWARKRGEHVTVELLPGFTAQDNHAAANLGWFVTCERLGEPWMIHFHTSRGRENYEKGLREGRRLACRALLAVAIAAMEH